MNPIIRKMYEHDLFSQWLGIERKDEGPGYCMLEMVVRKEMLNGFGIAHGAISYALADSALAFASNSRGRHAVSIETSINHIKPIHAEDRLQAVAEEVSLGHRTGIYHIRILRGDELVALFKGVVYRKEKTWDTE